MFKDYLFSRQPVIAKILTHAFTEKHLSHAYLFTGSKGTKMLETAILSAQTLVCEHADPFACEVCENCQRILKGHYADMILINGHGRTIKKEEILNLQEQFSKTALEKSGKKIYILDQAENATPEALNSLLKFLEEPSGVETYAFLISEQPERLLSTIVSRCQTLQFRSMNAIDLNELLIEMEIDPYDAHIVSQLVNDPEEISATVESDDYQSALNLFGKFIDDYCKAPFLGELFMQTEILKAKEASENRARLAYFLKIGMLFFKDVLFQTETSSAIWSKRLSGSRANMDAMRAFTIFNDSEYKIAGNANLGLLIDSILYQLKEEHYV